MDENIAKLADGESLIPHPLVEKYIAFLETLKK
jgi:hypothetical protein